MRDVSQDEIDVISSRSWEITYEDYSTSTSKISQHVDDSLLDFSGYSNVIDSSPTGYHAYGTPEDSRDASNDPSVSLTSYEILESSSGDSNFEAERTSVTVLNTDGADGGSNGVVAYNEDSSSIEGSTEDFLGTELVDGSPESFLQESEIRDKMSCPEDRCLAAVDITTERTGWSHPVTTPEPPATIYR